MQPQSPTPTPTQNPNFLEEIRQLEDGIKIQTTRKYVGLSKLQYDQPFIEFKTSKPNPIFAYVFVGSLLVFAPFYAFFHPDLSVNQHIGLAIVAIACGWILIGIANQSRIEKSRTYTIRIDHTGITIAGTLYEWENIDETAILQKPSAKNPWRFLVVALKDTSTYECRDLSNFFTWKLANFPLQLSLFIEHFKPGPTNP